MERLSKYTKFFTLREKYPEHKKLIGELMYQFFIHSDTLPSYFYLIGIYKDNDIRMIFEELDIHSYRDSNCVKGLVHPQKYQTNIFLSEETRLAG